VHGDADGGLSSRAIEFCYALVVRFVALGLALSLALVSACSDDPPAPKRASSSSGSSGTSGSSGSSGEEDDAGGGGEITSASFRNDVVPILAVNCALTACHASKESNLGIHITYDPDQIYEELQKTSPTPGFGGYKFVEPGKPEESLLMAKMDGTQASLPKCENGCGKPMPPGELLPQRERDIVRLWIKNGAKND